MIIDHRTYTVPHGRMDEYLERYQKFGFDLQLQYLGNHMGSFVSEIGPLNQVIHLWGFESLADREVKRQRMERDPAWMDFRVRNAGSFVAQEAKILRPTSFSPTWLTDR